MNEYENRVEVLEGGRFKGYYKKDRFEINYTLRTFIVEDESYTFSNTQLRMLEAIVRCYPNPVYYERLEYFTYGDKDIDNTRRNIRVHLHKVRQVMADSKYMLCTVHGIGIAIGRREDG